MCLKPVHWRPVRNSVAELVEGLPSPEPGLLSGSSRGGRGRPRMGAASVKKGVGGCLLGGTAAAF